MKPRSTPSLTALFPALLIFGCSGSAAPVAAPNGQNSNDVGDGTDSSVPTQATDETSDARDDDARVGRFVRYDLVTKDPAAASTFYRDLFGWKVEEKDGGEISFSGQEIGRVRLASKLTSLKTGWISYIAVVDIDDVAVDVVGNGGEIVHAATATNGSREAIVRGPTGGAFGLRALTDAEPSRDLGTSAGSVYWAQLWTSDLAGALAFYQVIGEYTSNEFRFGAIRYQVLKAANGAPVGVTVNTPQGQRNRWLPFIRVEDVGQTIAAAKRLGAKVVTKPREIPGIGRLASLSTPSGGVIGIIKPPPPDSEIDD